MQHAGVVRGRERAAEVDAHGGRLGRVETAALGQLLGERAAAHELGPDAHAAVRALGAVDGRDVRVSHAREQPAFLDDLVFRVGRRRRLRRVQQLQRDLAIEARVPSAKHFTESA